MTVTSFIEHIKNLPNYQNQIVHIEHLPSREATYQGLDKPLHPALETALHKAGLHPLYAHQATAVNKLNLGKNVIVVTSAASGKTLCYNLPVLETILTEKGSRALYIFPTKALAQDQLRSLAELVSLLPTPVRSAPVASNRPSVEITTSLWIRKRPK